MEFAEERKNLREASQLPRAHTRIRKKETTRIGYLESHAQILKAFHINREKRGFQAEGFPLIILYKEGCQCPRITV